MAKTNTSQVKKPRPKNNSNKASYQPLMFIIGLVLIFMSLIALFNWGFLGAIYSNFFRLFVGEAFDIALVGFLYMGAWMVIRGRVFPFQWDVFIGIVLIFLAITSVLHFNTFFPQEPLIEDIFATTFSIFKNEFLTGQQKISLGGGMLGALAYQLFGYLFGRWGTYLFATLIFFIGLFLLVQITPYQVQLALISFGQGIGKFFGKSANKISEAKQVYQENRQKQVQVEDKDLSLTYEAYENYSNDAYSYSANDEANMVNYDGSSDYQDRPSFTSKFRDFAAKFFPLEPYIEDIDGTSPPFDEFDAESVYQPIKDFNRRQEWDTFEEGNIPLATTASAQREIEFGEKILDLDYFDEMHQEVASKDQNSKRPTTNQSQRIYRFDQEDYQDTPVNHQDTSAISDENKPARVEMSSNSSLRNAEISESKAINANGYTDNVLFHESMTIPEPPALNQAGHWQEKANDKQNLTTDSLEETLEEQELQPVASDNKKVKKHTDYQLPGKDLLTKRPPVDQSAEYEKINHNIEKLEQTFQSFGVDARVVKANLGPAVTKYEIEPAVGVKVSKIVSLTDDIALALAARDIRMEAPIPGKSLIGIEVPNSQISPVSFHEIVDAALESDKILEVPLGRDVAGAISTADLSKMPHLLIAGSTGSGKSVGMNVIICSLLMKARPEEVKLLMIDPKKVELTMYNDIPHLLAPVVTNPRKAAKALNQVVAEMEDRYEKFASVNVRNQESYNEYIDNYNKENGTGYEKMPKIVVFIDELADLMLVAGNEVENAIIRLAQMARAAGIHMIIATQRPSVDVITGIIKANIPSRLAFAVTSGTDSRTILDSNGAEKLLGKGDMLFQPITMNKPVRVQGAFISDAEVERITNFIKHQRPAEYDESMIISDDQLTGEQEVDDEYFEDAVELIKDQETVSISQLQRKFRIGYNRAARLIDDLESLGYIGPADGSKPRQVYINE